MRAELNVTALTSLACTQTGTSRWPRPGWCTQTHGGRSERWRQIIWGGDVFICTHDQPAPEGRAQEKIGATQRAGSCRIEWMMSLV